MSPRVAIAFAIVLVALLVSSVRGEVQVLGPEGEMTLQGVGLPLEFSVPEGWRLYIEGQETRDVLFERDVAGSLSVNGALLRLTPMASVWPHSLVSEQSLLAICTGVSFFDRCLAEGAGVREAATRLLRTRRELESAGIAAHRDPRARGVGQLEACEAALEAMRRADADSLVDWDASPQAYPGDLRFTWRGPRGRLTGILFRGGSDIPGYTRSEQLDEQYVAAVRYYASERPDTCWVFIDASGSGTAYCGARDVAAVRGQIEQAVATGEMCDYPLPVDVLSRVVESLSTSGAEESTLPN